MEVRERDDSLGWDDDGLPGGLAFTDDDGLPYDDDEPAPGGRRARSLAWLLVLAVLLGGTGAYLTRWVGEADLRQVLAGSTATYGDVLTRLRLAQDAAALSAAAATAPRAAERLQDELGRLEGGGERRAVVADQVAAERQVLLAVAALEGVDAAPLAVWGAAHGRLSRAVTEEGRTRAALRTVDGDTARRLPDSAVALRRISATVGGALVGDVQRTAGELLADLGAATKTADLRAAAERAPAQRDAVLVAGEGLRGTPGAPVLESFAAALMAVHELRDLSPAETGAWVGVRAALEEHLGAVGDADGSLTGGTVRASLPLVLRAVDGVVDRAAAAHAAWQPVHDAAVAQQAADTLALHRYGSDLKAWGAAHAQLRSAVPDLARRAAREPASAVARTAGDLSGTAGALAEAVAIGTAPPGTEQAHAVLVQASRALADPLRRVAFQLTAPDCPDCPQGGSAVAADLVAAERAAADWAGAAAAAEQARVAAEQAVAARALPPPPDA